MSFRAYDAANRLTSVTNGYLTTNQSVYATLTYTNNNQVATVKDAINNLTTLVRDAYDRVTQVQFPLPTAGSNASNTSDHEGYTYDGSGNVLTRRLRSGDTVSFTYDALNRATVEQFPTGTSQNVYWTYDLLGRMLSAATTSPGGPGKSWAYDALGRVLTATSTGVPGASSSRTLAYQYDAAGNRTRITWPETGANALYVNYLYDVLNRVTQIQENGATSGAGLLATYSYDSLGRRSSIARAGGSGAGTTYGYDGAGRLNSLIQSLAGSAAVTYSFGFNAANQTLTRQVTNDAYTAHPGAITAGYVANGLNQYSSVAGTTQSADARGNLTSDGTRSFGYSLDNQLLTGSAPTATSFTYDPLGRLQTQTTGGAAMTYLYDGANLVEEYDSAGNILRRYVPGPGIDEPVVWYEGGGTATRNWLTADQQGSIIAYADQSGNAGATYTYGPYGEPITSTGAQAWGGSRYRYTGQIEIPEARLYYYKARVYDPGQGRFFQTDPIGSSSDVNLYAYVGNDPINGGDPTGLSPTPIDQIIVTAIKLYSSIGDFVSGKISGSVRDIFGTTVTPGTLVGELVVTAQGKGKGKQFGLGSGSFGSGAGQAGAPQNGNSCAGVDFSAGGSLNGALISPGGSVGAEVIVHVPGDLRHGWQVSVVGQGTFTWGFGLFGGAGASFGFPASSSTQPSGGSPFKTEDFIAEGGWGPSASVEVQGDRNGTTASMGGPHLGPGVGYGGYVGKGTAWGARYTSPAFGC